MTPVYNPRDETFGYGRLTEEGFVFTPSHGTCTNPSNINDGVVANAASFTVIGQYAEIILPACLEVTQFDHYGHAANGAGGRFQLAYRDVEGVFNTWLDNIPTIGAAWAGWASPPIGMVRAIAIRFTCMVVDPGQGHVGELKVKY